jgi:hypothetical protein
MPAAQAILMLAAGYAGLGLLFAIAFLARGVSRIDRAAAGAGVGFRLIILPGVVALWPVMLRRWVRR